MAAPKHPTEQWLDDLGIEYDRKMVPLDAIDVEKSRHNQARFEPLNEERVQRYVEAKKAGATFPPLLGYALKNGKVEILDGNHRHEMAIRVGSDELLPFYLVNVDADQTDKISWAANMILNGARLTVEEQKAHAVRLSEQKIPVKEVAVLTGLSGGQVSHALAADRATRRAASLKILVPFSKLSESQRIAVGRIQLDAAFQEAVEWVANTAVPSSSTEAACRVVAKSRSEADALETLRHEIKVREDALLTKKQKKPITPYRQALMQIAAIASLPESGDVVASMPSGKLESFTAQVEKAQGLLAELHKQLDKLS